MAPSNPPAPADGGDHSGGGPQGEHLEGSLTDGGAMPGDTEADRTFGAGKRRAAEHPPADPAKPGDDHMDDGA